MPNTPRTPRLLAPALIAVLALAFAGSAFASPTNTTLPSISGTTKEGSTLTANPGGWSGSGTITFAYLWKRCPSQTTGSCTAVTGATAKTYTLSKADVGYAIKVRVTATDSKGSTSAASNRTALVTAVVVSPSTTGSPVVSGSPSVGQTLKSSSGSWTGSTPMTYNYQWKRCDSGGSNCASVSGATAALYALTSSDLSSTMRVAVTASNSGGSATATSSATGVVSASAPVNTALPAVSGVAQQGQTLTASTGTWTGSAPISYAYQWQRCDSTGFTCSSVSGATGSSLLLGSGDVGSRIRVVVTATNSVGSQSATSNATLAVTGSSSGGGGGGGSVVLVDRAWHCTGPVNLDLVKVTMNAGSDNGIYLENGCTGRIGRIEIDTSSQDGIKVHDGSHDLVIQGGYIACHARSSTVHQDGIQAQAGTRITFGNLTIDCPTSNNGALFISSGNSGNVPTDIVCDHCMLKPANSTVNIKASVRSGVRYSTICDGRSFGLRIQDGAIDPVNIGNLELAYSDYRCASTS